MYETQGCVDYKCPGGHCLGEGPRVTRQRKRHSLQVNSTTETWKRVPGAWVSLGGLPGGGGISPSVDFSPNNTTDWKKHKIEVIISTRAPQGHLECGQCHS